MQINLNVIKNISYNHEAVIIKEISSRVSTIINYLWYILFQSSRSVHFDS